MHTKTTQVHAPFALTRFATVNTLALTMQSNRRIFLKEIGCGAASLAFLPYLSSIESAVGKPAPRVSLGRSTPEAQGVSSQGILDFLKAVSESKHEFHSLMVLRHGRVVAEGWWNPYRPEAPHMLYSLSKSFTSTAVGFAVSENRIAVTDKVIRFFPTQLPEQISENLRALTIKDLLTMSVGHAEDSTGSLWGTTDWAKQFLSLPIPNTPGTKFLYNSGATYMLSAIVQRVTGQRIMDYLKPRLFDPLGIKGQSWETCPEGINTGGWGLKLKTEDLARFGLLYLQRGSWNGNQLLPAAWVEEATTFKIQQPSPDLDKAKANSDWHQGYCYQFWRCRHKAYRGDGAFGQYMIVLPEQEAVIAITSESSNMQGQMNLVWEHLLPAMKSAPLPPAKEAQGRLKETLGHLALRPVQGVTPSLVPPFASRTYILSENSLGFRKVTFSTDRKACRLAIWDARGEHSVTCGLGKWLDGETSMPGCPPKLTRGDLGPVHKVAASAAWSDPEKLRMLWRFYETPHHDEVTCHFEGKKLRLEFMNSISAMNARPDSRPALEGECQAL